MNNELLNHLSRKGMGDDNKFEALLIALKVQLEKMRQSEEFLKQADGYLEKALTTIGEVWSVYGLLYGVKQHYKEFAVTYLVFGLEDVDNVLKSHQIPLDALTTEEKLEALHSVQDDNLDEDDFAARLIEYLQDNYPHVFNEDDDE